MATAWKENHSEGKAQQGARQVLCHRLRFGKFLRKKKYVSVTLVLGRLVRILDTCGSARGCAAVAQRTCPGLRTLPCDPKHNVLVLVRCWGRCPQSRGGLR